MAWASSTAVTTLFGVRVRALAAAFTGIDLAEAGEGKQPTAPTAFRIFKGGVNTSTKGDFLFDDKAADLVMAFYAKRGLVNKMDFEHQSINTIKNGQPAPNSAYSWTPQVRRGDDGQSELWATDVKWTDRARALIEAREYSYFSPLFDTDDDNRVTAVLNVGLTNLPALDGIDELMAASAAADNGKDRPMAKKMTCTKCSKALRAPTDDDDGDSVACSACLTAAMAAKALTALSVAVGLKSDAGEAVALGAVQELVIARDDLKKLTASDSLDAALGVVKAWKESHGQVVALRAEAEAGKQTARNREFGELLDKGMTEKKLTKDFRESYWEKTHAPGGNATEAGLVQLRSYIGAAPVIVGGGPPPKQHKTGPGPVTVLQRGMADAMGFSKEKLERFNKDREEQMAAGE